MLKSLLIANRGEIACRIIRTARAMGVRTIAVYSDADAKALHVRQADEAVHIGPSPARESYLVGEKIIAAARQTGAEAIHPGYGFLSENADFAQAVIDAGIIWVGPNPDSIRAMGLKDAAKERMIAADVPVTPGYLGADQSPERLAAEAAKVGYPVLIKAVAGGGGKGMRRVDAPEDFADALLSCQREAASSFGNTQVLIEKYILSPRHIEVQVFGDSHGNVVHLFERDCSLQRRHQKVIEEAPAPGMGAATRDAICAAAVRAAKAVDYVGAGTIEFIADASEGLRADRIWFMEMNTRLQVEHPVTEEITGQDLVEWQLRVASGEPLPKRQEELRIKGWAIEARLYAEDPSNGFLPSIGKLAILNLPASHDIRLEMAVQAGDEISPYYDPMIGKIIATGKTRQGTISRFLSGMHKVALWPVKSNAGFLWRAVDHEAFRTGELDTGFIERNLASLVPNAMPETKALVAASLWLGVSSPPIGTDGFRLNRPDDDVARMYIDGQFVAAPGYPDEGEAAWSDLINLPDGSFLLVHNAQPYRVTTRYEPGSSAVAADGSILSPMPGRIIAVEVAAGDTVTKGQKLLTLEAMKMEHSLVAPFDGTVAELNAETGAQVTEGAVLALIERTA